MAKILRILTLAWMACATLLAHGATVLTVDSLDAGVALPAYWFAAPAGNIKGPAVVALHGCGGLLDGKGALGAQRQRYVRMLHGAGIGVLFIDSFAPRGQDSICSQQHDQRSITEVHRRLDVYGALQWLARQPGVDAQRLGVIGWSHGGQTVLASANLTEDAVQQATVRPAALVAFYPGCSAITKAAAFRLVAPLLVMSGALDDWTPAAACRRWTAQLAATPGHPVVQYIEYANSYHGFDSVAPPRVRDGVGGTRSGKATVGGNPQAREQSAAAMLQFLQAHLQR